MYIGSTYDGQVKKGGCRNHPLPHMGPWGVGGWEVAGVARSGDASESFRNSFGSGLEKSDRPDLRAFVDSMQPHRNFAEKAISDINIGEPNSPRKAQFDRESRMGLMDRTYGGVGDMDRSPQRGCDGQHDVGRMDAIGISCAHRNCLDDVRGK